MTVMTSVRSALKIGRPQPATDVPRRRGELDPIRSMMSPDNRITVGVLVYRGVTSGEIDEPVARLADRLRANVALVGSEIGPVHAVEPSRTVIAGFDPTTAPPVDVLVVPGGLGWRQVLEQPGVSDWLRVTASTASGILAISTGSLLLASVGRLTGKSATGHWLAEEELAAFGAHVESNRTAHDEMGRVVTASGVLAAMTQIDELASRSQWSRWAPTPGGS